MGNLLKQLGRLLRYVFQDMPAESQGYDKTLNRVDNSFDARNSVAPHTIGEIDSFMSIAEKGSKIPTSELRHHKGEPLRSEHTGTIYPRETKKELYAFYGEPGEHNLVRIKLPYPMHLSWDKSVEIHSLKCHKKVAEDLKGIFEDTLEYYGIDEIKRLGLDEYGGCYNYRKIRGGKRWSTHAWGIAVDIKTTTNRFRWRYPKATLSKDEYRPFWKIVKSHGAYSLGVNRGYDWMHFQWAYR